MSYKELPLHRQLHPRRVLVYPRLDQRGAVVFLFIRERLEQRGAAIRIGYLTNIQWYLMHHVEWFEIFRRR